MVYALECVFSCTCVCTRVVDVFLNSVSGDGRVLFWSLESQLKFPEAGYCLTPTRKYHGASLCFSLPALSFFISPFPFFLLRFYSLILLRGVVRLDFVYSAGHGPSLNKFSVLGGTALSFSADRRFCVVVPLLIQCAICFPLSPFFAEGFGAAVTVLFGFAALM